MSDTVLDNQTKAALAAEVDRLVAMGTERREARRIVWLDYLDEQAQCQPQAPSSAPAPAETEAAPPSTPPPGPEPPPAPPLPPRRFWRAEEEARLTPEWLAKNRAALSKVKQLLRKLT
ncbi:hypothetical protein O166_05030 [Pseudogulbenkiania ferrooxidans EGD-HP2]|uniref:Uncharacterized protein n=1 Tax=Pseudogulbenkiania ferrooxidans EGD-HP2 TaxID=1388764 RepID=A0ABN0N8G5_9NEIS|nr:hypothetical protein O166_05030 [Pseudogulbenkiania ferrooxidans EGD-HP2]